MDVILSLVGLGVVIWALSVLLKLDMMMQYQITQILPLEDDYAKANY